MKFTYENMLKLSEEKKEFRVKTEIVDGVEIDIFSYMVCLTNTFDSELAKEFRGCCFTKDGKCISRPLPKFFNVGERPDTHEDVIDWDNAKFYTKFDGSMAIPVLVNNKVFWRTKNSFFSDVAVKIQKYYENNAAGVFGHQNLKRMLNHFTPIFEYVAPHNRIVLEYEKEDLVYLGFRDLHYGDYVPATTIQTVSKDEIKSMKGIEGFVIHDGNQLVKMKTDEYFELHKIVSDFNPKTIIKASLNETIDDMLGVVSQLKMVDRHTQIQNLRDETLNEKLSIESQIKDAWSLMKPYVADRKLFAEHVISSIRNELKPFMFLIIDQKKYVDKIDKLVYDTVYARYKPTKEI